MAQGDEFAGFLGRHDGGHAGDAQHVAFFGATAFYQRTGGWQHVDAACGDGDAPGVGFVGHIDHMGLAGSVKVGKCVHKWSESAR